MRTLVVFTAACLAFATQANAVINPKLQPSHLASGYLNVVQCRVTAIDNQKRTATLQLDGVAKGDFSAKQITLTAESEDLADAILTLNKGQKVVAYVGKRRIRHENDILYYIGRGVWYLAEMPDSPDQWNILSNADKGINPSSSEIMFGTFNGEPESLWELMEDTAKKVAYFPATPLTRFSLQNIATLDQSARGVGIYDISGDGRCDLLVCSKGGNRLFLQNDDGQFTDAAEQFGLAATKSASCSIADADADGDADLLLDGVLYKQTDGKFAKSGDVPGGAGCLSAAFFAYNGDGYPDVIISREDEGLALYVNPGESGGAFADESETAGMTDESCGGGQTGYFETCDWDFDGRGDLIFVSGPGLLLWQNQSGQFEPFEIGDPDADYSGGTAAFGMIARPAVASAYLMAGDQKSLVCEDAGNLMDVTRAGNEIQDPVSGMLMALAEDLNCDGTVDLYAASQAKGMASFYVANRGYGSFMLPEKYMGGKIVPPAVYNQPAWGLAAGDVNNDGAPDVLVGGIDGKVSLLINETLKQRPEMADVATINDVRKQIQTRVLTVKCQAKKGLHGARLSLLSDEGKALTHRWIGANVGVGCCGPGKFLLAVREPGSYKLQVQLSDGTKKEKEITIGKDTPRHQVVTVQ